MLAATGIVGRALGTGSVAVATASSGMKLLNSRNGRIYNCVCSTGINRCTYTYKISKNSTNIQNVYEHGYVFIRCCGSWEPPWISDVQIEEGIGPKKYNFKYADDST